MVLDGDLEAVGLSLLAGCHKLVQSDMIIHPLGSQAVLSKVQVGQLPRAHQIQAYVTGNRGTEKRHPFE
jgi:hypothetical protein